MLPKIEGLFEFLAYLFKMVTTKKFRDKLEVWCFHSLIVKMKIVIFKTNNTKGLSTQFTDAGWRNLESSHCDSEFLKKFDGVPHKFGYYDVNPWYFSCANVEFGDTYDENMKPDFLVYFEKD